MDRREFLTGATLSGAGLLASASTQGAPTEGKSSPLPGKAMPLVLRPYQLLCAICSLGEPEPGRRGPKIAAILEAVRAEPDRPITLVSNAGDVYVWQDPGTADDTPEGRDYNRKRDLDILQRMSWPPGVTLPARAMFMSLLRQIETVRGICGYDQATAEAWRGCPRAKSGCYEKGRSRGIAALVPPRPEEEMAKEKEASLKALYAAKEVTIRPHILLCAVCQYGGGLRPPYKCDNLPELLELVLKKPDLPITFARGADWMMCAPCPQRVSGLNACINVLGSGGLSNEKRDLDMLQRLGLHFGSTMKAKTLFGLIFEKIPSTAEICRREGNVCPGVWWDPCGESNAKKGNPDYEKGRKALMERFGLASGGAG